MDKYTIIAKGNPSETNTYDTANRLNSADDIRRQFLNRGFTSVVVYTSDDPRALSWVNDYNGQCNYALN
jgi:hypothetical protein